MEEKAISAVAKYASGKEFMIKGWLMPNTNTLESYKLVKELGGIRDMNRLPQALFVIDTNKEALAVDEARKLHIPVVALADTNSDPDKIDYPIPANDDSISSITLLTTLMADAVAEGLLQAGRAKSSEKESAQQPLAEWETDLLEGQGQETK